MAGAQLVLTPALVPISSRSRPDLVPISSDLTPSSARSRPCRRLSVDHVATDPSEVRGVQERGGHVVNNRVGGTLAVTRALGDHSLKGGSGGVTAEPYCCTHTCGAADRFVVMASDGVWDVISDADVQRLVLQHAHLPPPEIAQKLVQAAIAGMSRDNISALVVRLR